MHRRTSHQIRRPTDRLFHRPPVTTNRLRLESLRDFVPMQTELALFVDAFADVLREIASAQSRFLKPSRPHREIAEELDMDMPETPDIPDQRLLHKPAHREMNVQPVSAAVPFRDPDV